MPRTASTRSRPPRWRSCRTRSASTAWGWLGVVTGARADRLRRLRHRTVPPRRGARRRLALSAVLERPAVVVDGVSKSLRAARRRRCTRSRSGRCIRSGAAASDALRRAPGRLVRGRARRVLRHRRPQRVGQEHAAQVPGRHLRRRHAARSTSTAGVSTFIELGVGFNPDLAARDNAILNAIMLGLTRARGGGALRADPRLLRAATSSRTSSSRTTRRACSCGWRSR